MSTLPVLVSALAEVDGRDRPTIEYFARTIREAGYITTGKRGLGAPKMTFREAGNLIIGLNGADNPKEAPVAIDRFRSLRQTFTGDAGGMKAHTAKYENAPQPIKDVMDVHTFGEALDALIEGAPALFATAKADCSGMPDDFVIAAIKAKVLGVRLTFARYAAKIELTRQLTRRDNQDLTIDFKPDQDRPDGFYGSIFHHDRDVTVTIGLLTLIAAWKGLNPDIEFGGRLEAEG